MKKFIIPVFCLGALVFGTSCENQHEEETITSEDTMMTTETEPVAMDYIDLQTGQPVVRDETRGTYVNQNNEPVTFYVDVVAHDTFYAPANQNVNTYLMYDEPSSMWKLDESRVKVNGSDIIFKDGDSKVKLDTRDGDIKVKDENGKMKIDGDDGRVKVK